MLGIGTTHLGAIWLYILNMINQQDEIILITSPFWIIKYFLMIVPLALYSRYVHKKIHGSECDTCPQRRNGDA